MSGRRLVRFLTSFLAFFSVLLSGLVAPVWFVPISKASAAPTTADCVVGSSLGVSVSLVGNDCILTFSQNTSWTIPTGISSLRLLLVGGGAGGQVDGGGGGGGGGGVTKSGVSVTSGIIANIRIGSGGSFANGGGSTELDLDGNNVYEWVAPGGNAGGAWDTRLGGSGGTPSAQNSATTLNGGRGGDGPEPRGSGTNASNTGIGDGFQSDITGQSLWYGGGGGGGMGAHSNNNSPGELNGGNGGLGGGGRGAAQRASNFSSTVTWEYGVGVSTTPVSLTPVCSARSDFPKTTMGFPGLDGYGGGGGGGAAYGDGCKGATDTWNDGERTAGGDGGDGVVIIRYSLTAPAQVTGLTATARDREIALTWSAPSSGGTAITDYVIEQSTDNSTWTTISDGTSTTTSYTVTGLINSKNYYFRVSAVNAVGTGTASSSVKKSPEGLILSLDAANSSSYTGAGSTWTDLSGNGMNGTIIGPSFVEESEYFSLDGTNDYVDLPDGFENFTNGLTIQAYVDFGSNLTDTWERIIDLGKGELDSNIFFGRYIGTDQLTLDIVNNNPGNGYCTTVDDVIVDGFADYAFTLDGENCKIYVNGTLVHTEAYTALPNEVVRTSNFLGKSNWSADQFLDDGFKRIKIYNTVLTSTQINANRTFTVGSGTCEQTVYQDYSNIEVTLSDDNNYCIVQFKNVGTTQWQVPVGTSSGRVMVVGGGGGGGSSATWQTGGSGGAGGFFESNSVPLSGVIDIGVGGGGSGTNSNSSPAGSGADSYLGTLKVGGGGGGNSVNIGNVRAGSGRGGIDYIAGGNGGGGRWTRVNDNGRIGGLAGARADSITFAGSNFTGINASVGGNGGGDGSGGIGGAIAGASRTSDITGTSTEYAKSGTYSPWSGLNQTFGSGGAANYNYGSPPGATGGNGAAGIVIVRYALADSPDQVTGLTATAGSEEISLSWTTPSDGGSAITDYVIEQSINDSTWTTVSDGVSTSTSYTVTGLTTGQIYYFRVFAKNVIGTGTASNTASATPISEIDYSLDFDGLDDQLTLGSQIIADTGDYTIEAWAYDTNTTDGTHVIVYHGARAEQRSFIAAKKSGSSNVVELGIDGNFRTVTSIAFPQNQWVHVALTRSGNTYSFYLNGNLQLTGTKTRGVFSDGFSIGGYLTGVQWKGKIDQVKLFNDDLTQAQIETSMHTYGNITGETLLAHYDFNNVETSTVSDITVNNNDLTVSGSMSSADYEDVKSEVTSDGTKVITFPRTYLTGLEGWKVPAGVSSVRTLVVGGGGGGGAHVGGGGGAGGVLETRSHTPSDNYVSVVVGAGGRGAWLYNPTDASGNAGCTNPPAGKITTGAELTDPADAGLCSHQSRQFKASNGQSSVFDSITALGGGNGGSWDYYFAGNGGSGGGASHPMRSVGTGAAGQGFAGGSFGSAAYSFGKLYYSPGGGGGADAVGGNGINGNLPNPRSGNGGPGKTSDISGVSVIYGCGGGGGGHDSTNPGDVPGSAGCSTAGAGSASTSVKAQSGSANFGGGGGGSGANNRGSSQGGDGGSGVVIVSYELFSPPSISTHPASATVLAGNNQTLSVTATNVSSYQWQVSTNGGVTWSNTGTDSASLTLSAVSSSMNANQYRVVVTRTVSGVSASVTSNIAILTVEDGATVTGAFCDNTYTKNGLTVGAGHGEVFYIDTGQGQEIDAGYIAYTVESDTARSDLWVEVSEFTGGVVSLANPNDSAQPLGSVTAGGTGTAYFMIKATGGTTTAQAHLVKIYNKKPTIGNPAPIYTCSFTFVEVAETIKAAANKVNSITSTTTSSLGSTMTITVLGDTGTIGQGNDIDGRMIWLTPAARSSWPTNALRLERVTLDLYSNSQRTSLLSSHTNVLRVNTANGLSGNNRQYYRAVYTFRVIGAAAAVAPIIPIAMISSGTQIKHTDVGSLPTGGTASVNLTSPEIDLTVTKSVSSTTSVNNDGTTSLSYTITMTNGDANTLIIDEVVDDPDTNLTFVANSAEFNGSSIDDPGIITGDKVAFSGPMTLPGNSSRTITYDMKFETCAVGSTYSFDNVATARTGTVVIGSGSASQTAVNIAGNCGQSQATVTVTQQPIPPEVITGNSSSVTASSATIAGVVDPNGESGLAVRFVYGTSSALTGGTAVNLSTTTFATDGYGVSTNLSSLSGDTTYYYRLEVQDADGNWVQGTIRNFKTLPTAGTPDAVTTTVSGITTTSAILNGTIDPNYVSGGSKARFEYATDASSGSCSSLGTTQTSGVLQSEGASGNEDAILLGGAPTAMTYTLSGLTSGAAYCYRIVALYSTGYATVDEGSWLPFEVTAKTAQTITWGTSANPLPAGGTTTVSATTTAAGLSVTYTSADTNICTVNSSTGAVSAVANSGTCTITASQSGNSTYYAAVSKTISFPILPPVITPATLVNGTYQTSGYSQTLIATGGDGTYSSWAVSAGSLPSGLSLNSSTGVISGTPTSAGIYNFSVTVESNGITSAAESFRITVAKVLVTVTASSPSVVFGGAAPSISPSYSGFIGSDESSAGTSPNIAPTCTSTYVVGMGVSDTPTTSCSSAWNENYIFTYVPGAITITKFPLTITALDATKQNIESGSNTEVTQDPALRYVISPSLPAGQTITNALPSGVTITRANSGTGIGTLLTASLPAGEQAPTTHAITVSATPGANYSVTTVDGTFTVQTPKQVPTIIASSTTITYGDSGVPSEIGAISRARDLTTIGGTFNYYKIESDLTETEIDANTVLDAGLYTIKIKFTATDTNAYISPVYSTINLTVNKKAVTVTAADKKKIEGQLDPTFTWSASGLVGSDASTLLEPITISRTSGEDPGSYTISTSGGGHPNYSITRVNGNFFISKVEITVTATRGILTSKTVQADCAGAKPGATATFTIETTSPATTLGTATVQNDGSCPITATIPDDIDQGNHTLKIATIDPLDGAINTTNRVAFIASAIITNNNSGGGSGGSGGSGSSGGGSSPAPATSPSPTVSPTPTRAPGRNNLPGNRLLTPPRIIPPNNNPSNQNSPLSNPTPTNSINPQAQGPTNLPGTVRPLPEVVIPSLPGFSRLLNPSNTPGLNNSAAPNANSNSGSNQNPEVNNQAGAASNPQAQGPVGSPTQRTIDFGDGVRTVEEIINEGGEPSSEQARRSLTEVQGEKLAGFDPPGASTRIEIIGARTGARFVVSNQSQIDTFTLIEAIQRSIPTQAQDFAEITNIDETQTPRLPNEWSEEERNYAAEIFAASGLAAPVNLRDLYSDQFNSWIKIDTRAETYLPGSIVYLTVTSDPLVIGSAVVDRDGFVQISGDMPIEWLQAGEHRIRLVGIRALDGVSVDDQGEVQLSEELISEIEKFDLGTQATITVIGPNASGGEHAALRVVPLIPTAPWWTMWIILGVGLIALFLRRKNYLFNKQRRYAGLIAVGLASLPAVIIGWFSTVTLVVWVGIGATLLSLALNWIVPVKKDSEELQSKA